ncbi:MAG: STAS domain-containing protein [Deltaproteobacteria bacterium]|nr:STAS domain-containing protein [Deltaproteobacteria bacterium]
MAPSKSGKKAKRIQVDVDKLERLVQSLDAILKGRLAVRPDIEFDDPTMEGLTKQVGEVSALLDQRVDEYNRMAINMNLGVSECIKALREVKHGRLHARVSDTVLQSDNELIVGLGETLNETLDELSQQLEMIQHQQIVIQELSTPILQVWDSVLVLPVIGIVDTRRSMEIMERLLSEIVDKQSRFVILDITGVEVVDTKTADHFLKLIKAAELLGATCMLTGIRPAVAQTLADLGVDLSSITTLRNLHAGLRECLRRKGESSV